eukprot:1043165-Alexandrium_andersonii.AAC.1
MGLGLVLSGSPSWWPPAAHCWGGPSVRPRPALSLGGFLGVSSLTRQRGLSRSELWSSLSFRE